MLWSATTISTLSADSEPTVVVQFESGKYIFNAGENTGRSWLQSRNKWSKTKAIFLTQNGTQRGAGLPGLMMFLADATTTKLDVVGPQGLFHFLASMRSYLWRDGMHVNVTQAQNTLTESDLAKPTPLFRDANVEVFGIPIFASPSTETSVDTDAEPVGAKRKRGVSPESSSSLKRPHRGQMSDVGLPTESVLSEVQQQSFSPSALRGEHAEEWRRLTIDNMFPAEPPKTPAPSEVQKQKKKSKKDAASNVQEAVVPPPTPQPRPYQSSRHPTIQTHRDRLLPRFEPMSSKPALSYVVVGPAVRGKFDAKKANDMGVPRGPIRRDLTLGQSVTFEVDDGHGGKVKRMVHSHELMGPSDPPHVVMILDVPTIDHIPSLASSFANSPFYSKLRSHDEEHRKEFVVHAIFHLCGKDVLESEAYKAFMTGFHPATHHVVASRQHAPNPVTFTSAAANQLALTKLDAVMFPPHHYRLHSPKDLTCMFPVSSLPPNVHLFRSGLNVDVRPARGPILDQASLDYDRFHPIATGERSLEIEEKTLQAFEDAQIAASKLDAVPAKPEDGVTIIPLGTSSALPSKYRNVSSTLIMIPGHGNILLDCGEGTWGQIARSFGSDVMSSGAWEVLRGLKCIYLSHIHGDHHIGLAKVLAMRKQLDPPPSEPLYVVGIRSVHLYTSELNDLEDLGVDDPTGNGVIPILSDSLNFRGPYVAKYGKWQLKDGEKWMDHQRSERVSKEMCAALGLKGFTTVDVDHRTRCYGLVIDHRDGWRIVFSGDTKPTQNLVRAGKGATVLIHEATMGDDQEELAAQKAHSTMGQAVRIGTEMEAQNIMLTHFSARYPKMPPALLSNDYTANVVLAFDHARVRIGDMRKLRAYLPAMEQFYGSVAAMDEDPEEDAEMLVHVDAEVPEA
ncbi:hypothetical protein BXZ70DRAFT_1073609 [Cristinia sonorae]|uniref:ribonuclease Z n=1 Tax=Cristinia sonorae TaxID=1940300 RepID=A0A8K0UFR0_9AGAR|nr:hypothetical protein BXZ70DRAFT_1073609 [Cristinia sonorae]